MRGVKMSGCAYKDQYAKTGRVCAAMRETCLLRCVARLGCRLQVHGTMNADAMLRKLSVVSESEDHDMRAGLQV